MHRLLPTLFIILACATAPGPAPVQAGTGVQRCRSIDGATLYTDKACRAFGARAVPVSDELSSRILRERAHERALTMSAVAFGADTAASDIVPVDDARLPGASVPPSRRSVAKGCARTPTQLQMDLRGAFALGDVNRIAESYHWVGISNRAAMRIMDRLAMLARGQVVDTQYFDAQIGSASEMYADAGTRLESIGGTGGVLQVEFASGQAGSITDFDVERYKGCYFVRF